MQSKSSQMHGLKKIDHASRESSLERQKALSKGPVLDSPRQSEEVQLSFKLLVTFSACRESGVSD